MPTFDTTKQSSDAIPFYGILRDGDKVIGCIKDPKRGCGKCLFTDHCDCKEDRSEKKIG